MQPTTHIQLEQLSSFLERERESVRDLPGENATNENTPTRNPTNQWTLQAFALSHNYIIIGVADSTIFHRFDLSYHHHSRRSCARTGFGFRRQWREHMLFMLPIFVCFSLFVFRASGKSVCVPRQNINMENRWLTLTLSVQHEDKQENGFGWVQIDRNGIAWNYYLRFYHWFLIGPFCLNRNVRQSVECAMNN